MRLITLYTIPNTWRKSIWTHPFRPKTWSKKGQKEQAEMFEEYCLKGMDLEYYIKPDCGHHSHSLEDVTPIVKFYKS